MTKCCPQNASNASFNPGDFGALHQRHLFPCSGPFPYEIEKSIVFFFRCCKPPADMKDNIRLPYCGNHSRNGLNSGDVKVGSLEMLMVGRDQWRGPIFCPATSLVCRLSSPVDKIAGPLHRRRTTFVLSVLCNRRLRAPHAFLPTFHAWQILTPPNWLFPLEPQNTHSDWIPKWSL